MSIPVTESYEYRQLTKILEVLEQQREQVIKDKEFIQSAYEEALKSPIEYIESLIEGKVKLPAKINIAKVPEFSVNLPKYNSNSNNNNNYNGGKRSTRPSLSSLSKVIPAPSSPPEPIESKLSLPELKTTTTTTTTTTSTTTPTRKRKERDESEVESEMSEESESDNNNNNNYITTSRNRKLSINQEAFYQDTVINKQSLSSSSTSSSSLKKKGGLNELKSYWTEEEQLKLEKLLIIYPEEEIASHRWNKIANELGGRTPSQIASRVQKFFAKLEKLGLEIPGATSTPKKKSKNSKSSSSSSLSSSDRSDNESSAPRPQVHKFFQQKRYEERKLNSNNKSSKSSTTTSTTSTSTSSSSKMIHEGFKCDGCDSEPIVGIRWHCEECPHEVDLCQDCKDKYEEIGSHLSSHHMSSVENPDPYFLDEDYKFSYKSGESNYLDPNYR